MFAYDVGEAFVRLGLAIDQHFPGYVDAYFGPEEIARSVRGREKVPLAELEDQVQHLAATVAHDETIVPRRREWLQGEVAAMRTTLRILQGGAPDILDEVRLLYGVTPAWVDESTFEEAHRALDGILPGTGPVAERVSAFRQRLRVSLAAILPDVKRLADELRRRTRAGFALPPEEACEFVFLRDKPWMANNAYQGSGKSRIEINEDRPFYLHQLPELLAHEAYPGHHTELAIKEQSLYQEEGWLEQAIVLSNTPTSLVSEGMAMNALRVIAEPEETVGFYGELLGAAGLPVGEASRVAAFVSAARPLNRVSDNQILLLHGEKVPEEEVVAYGVRNGMNTEEEERQLLRFHRDPLWRSYGFNYTIGRDLVEQYLSVREDRVKAFATLLSEPVTPRQLDLAADTQAARAHAGMGGSGAIPREGRPRRGG